MKVTCTNCTRQLDVDHKLAGKKVRCGCGNVFRVQAPSSNVAKIQFRCQRCSQVLRSKASDAGKLVACPCGAKLKIPAPKQEVVTPVVISAPLQPRVPSAPSNLARPANASSGPNQKARAEKPHFHTVYKVPLYRKMLGVFLALFVSGVILSCTLRIYFRWDPKFQDPEQSVTLTLIIGLIATLIPFILLVLLCRHKIKISKTVIEVTTFWGKKQFRVREVAWVYILRRKGAKHLFFKDKNGKILCYVSDVIGKFSKLEKWARSNFRVS